jgi:hypothetical protein
VGLSGATCLLPLLRPSLSTATGSANKIQQVERGKLSYEKNICVRIIARAFAIILRYGWRLQQRRRLVALAGQSRELTARHSHLVFLLQAAQVRQIKSGRLLRQTNTPKQISVTGI